jgi:NAD(P)H dehydrogenase (quinone)
VSADPLIAVTGSTGAVGSRVAARLAELGARRRLFVRDAARVPDDPGAEVRVASGYADAAGMRAALEGADTVLLVPARESEDRVREHLSAVDAAAAAGVGRIVYLSFIAAAPDAVFTLARDHWATEERIRATGLPHTFLRMSLYMDFVPSMVGEDGVIRGPGGDGRMGAILRDDVAAAAAAVLTSGGHDGRTYELTGPEAFTFAQAAELLTRLTGRTVTYEEETEEQAWASRRASGAPDWEIRGWVSSYLAVRAGELAAVTGDVRALTGRDPTSLAAHLDAQGT